MLIMTHCVVKKQMALGVRGETAGHKSQARIDYVNNDSTNTQVDNRSYTPEGNRRGYFTFLSAP